MRIAEGPSSTAAALRPAPDPPSRSYLVTCYAVEWERAQLWVNSVTLLVCVVAKLPEMHGVRIMQINSARVD